MSTGDMVTHLKHTSLAFNLFKLHVYQWTIHKKVFTVEWLTWKWKLVDISFPYFQICLSSALQ